MDVFWQTEPQHRNKYGALPSRQCNPRSTCIACMFPEDEGHSLIIDPFMISTRYSECAHQPQTCMDVWREMCATGVNVVLELREMVVNWLLYSSSSVEPSNCERCTCSAGYVITVSISDSSKYSLWCHSMRYPAVENGLGHQRHRSSQTGYRCS